MAISSDILIWLSRARDSWTPQASRPQTVGTISWLAAASHRSDPPLRAGLGSPDFNSEPRAVNTTRIAASVRSLPVNEAAASGVRWGAVPPAPPLPAVTSADWAQIGNHSLPKSELVSTRSRTSTAAERSPAKQVMPPEWMDHIERTLFRRLRDRLLAR